MSFRRIRRRRGEPIASALPFTDASDVDASGLLGTGAPQFFGASEAAPSPLAHRSLVSVLAELDSFAKGETFTRRGVWGELAPWMPRRSLPVVRVGGTAFVGRRVTPPPSLQAQQRINRSWRRFNVAPLSRKDVICVRRGVRRNVLFALSRVGRGRRGSQVGRPYRRGPFSFYSCR